jgi:uncharacterized membrane protein
MKRTRTNKRRNSLSRPRGGLSIGIHYDPNAFGDFSEAVAKFLGTARFLAAQTVVVIVWIFLNVAWFTYHWDKYPFILLNLGFSTQAAYAAPLILLAQSRQADRDRAQAESDRMTNQRTQAEAEFLARELASVRLQLADIVTTEDLDRAVDRIAATLERQFQRQPEETSDNTEEQN